jgi:hypothetical protein
LIYSQEDNVALTNVTGLWTGVSLKGTAGFCAGVKGEVEISHKDKEVLRGLAGQLAEYASRTIESEKRELWRKHNDLEQTRPLVFCDPENGWNEIFPESEFVCEGSLALRWEMVLRKDIFWAEQMKDDKVIEPFFMIGYTYTEDDWGLEWKQRGGGGGAYTWDTGIKDEKDIKKLHNPVFSVDYETTHDTAALARETFGDLLDIRLEGVWWWSFGMTVDLALWLGMEQMMLYMMDRPDLIKRLMGILRDGYLHRLDYLEENNLLSTNTDRYVGSGGFGYTSELPSPEKDKPVTPKHMWGFCESQETIGVSPEMFGEFIFPYQLPFLEKFGLNCYGCCEPVDMRWSIIKQSPNLRRVSVSPWTDLERMTSYLGDKYVISWKPSPAELALPAINEKEIRDEIRRALEITRGCHLEILMKDNHTIGNNPQNVIRWVEIVREEIDRVF